MGLALNREEASIFCPQDVTSPLAYGTPPVRCARRSTCARRIGAVSDDENAGGVAISGAATSDAATSDSDVTLSTLPDDDGGIRHEPREDGRPSHYARETLAAWDNIEIAVTEMGWRNVISLHEGHTREAVLDTYQHHVNRLNAMLKRISL